MLIQFSVENHRSLRDRQTLSMVTGPEAPSDSRLIACAAIRGTVLPVVAIYGANASGKSNVVDALGFMAHAVVESHRAWGPNESLRWQPFALGDETPGPTTYEMQVVVGRTRYRYGFSLTAERIESEWLHAWPNGKKQIWLERDRDTFEFGKNLRGENETIRRLTRPNSLFLSAAAQNNHPQLGVVAEAFATPHFVYKPLAPSDRTLSFTASELGLVLDREQGAGPDAEMEAIRALVRGADTGVEDLFAAPQEAGNVPGTFMGGLGGVPRRQVMVVQRSNASVPRALPLSAQSDGTKALLYLGVRLFKVLAAGGLLVIDELEASLHPTLARKVLTLFQDPVQNPKRAQLVFTTHDTNLLGSIVDEPALRRDQVWLTEKNEEGATTLYPLTDFHPRKQENLERGYLQGRYGAIPFIGDLVADGAGRRER
jgi:uncharacterized protein